MWMPIIALVGSALFLWLGYRHPRFKQPVLRSGLVADAGTFVEHQVTLTDAAGHVSNQVTLTTNLY
jgi:hypothetical protein